MRAILAAVALLSFVSCQPHFVANCGSVCRRSSFGMKLANAENGVCECFQEPCKRRGRDGVKLVCEGGSK